MFEIARVRNTQVFNLNLTHSPNAKLKYRHVMQYKIISLLCVLILISCSTNIDKKKPSEKGEPVYSNKKPLWKNKKVFLYEQFIIGTDDINQNDYILGNISSLAIDDSDNLYVLDGTMSRIQIYNKLGNLTSSFDLIIGKGPGEFQVPRSINIDSLGYIYIADESNRKI